LVRARLLWLVLDRYGGRYKPFLLDAGVNVERLLGVVREGLDCDVFVALRACRVLGVKVLDVWGEERSWIDERISSCAGKKRGILNGGRAGWGVRHTRWGSEIRGDAAGGGGDGEGACVEGEQRVEGIEGVGCECGGFVGSLGGHEQDIRAASWSGE
jgi:hypothetical protein